MNKVHNKICPSSTKFDLKRNVYLIIKHHLLQLLIIMQEKSTCTQHYLGEGEVAGIDTVLDWALGPEEEEGEDQREGEEGASSGMIEEEEEGVEQTRPQID